MIACTIRASRSAPRAGARSAIASAIARSRSGSRPGDVLCGWTARVRATRRLRTSPSSPSTSSIRPAEERQRVGAGPRHPDVRLLLLVGLRRRCARARPGRAGRRSARAGVFISKTHRQKPPGRWALTTSSSARADALAGAVGHDVQVVEPGRASTGRTPPTPPSASATQTSSCSQPLRRARPGPRRSVWIPGGIAAAAAGGAAGPSTTASTSSADGRAQGQVRRHHG